MKKVDLLYQNFSYVIFAKKNSLKSNFSGTHKFLTKKLENDALIKSYQLLGKKSDYYYDIENEEEFGQKIIALGIWLPRKWSNKELKNIIESAFSFNKKRNRLSVYIPVDKNNIAKLKKLGLKFDGFQYLGTTQNSLEYLDKYEFDKNLKAIRVNYDNMNSLVKLICSSHRTSKTSMANKITHKRAAEFLDMCKKKKYPVFIAKLENIIVGYIVPIKSRWGIGHIMDICVLPEYQGRGVSKYLYSIAVKHWSKKGIQMYSGVSRSEEVISFSKKLNREAVGVFFTLAKKDFMNKS